MNKLYFFCLFLLCGTLSAQTQNRRFNSMTKQVDEISNYQNAQAKELIDSMYEIARQSPDSLRLIVHCLCKEAKWSADQGLLDDSLLARIEKHSKKIDSTFVLEKAILQYATGLCQLAFGEYATSFSATLQALEQFKTLNDSSYISKSLYTLGNICSNINFTGLSRNYFSEALLWMPENSIDYYKTHYSIYLTYAFEKDMKTLVDSMQYLTSIISEKESSSAYMLTLVYISLATAYKKMDEGDSAEYYFNEAKNLITQIDNPFFKAVFYNNYGNYMKEKKDYNKALEYLTIARKLCEQDDNVTRSHGTYSGLASLFEILGEKDSAFYYLKKKDEISKKIIANNRAIEVYRQYIQAHTQIIQDKLTLSEQQVKLKNRMILLIAITAAAAISIALLLLLFMRQKKLRKEAENSKLVDDLTIKEFENQKQQQLIDAKNRELTLHAVLQSNKDGLFQKILSLHQGVYENREGTLPALKIIDDVMKEDLVSGNTWKSFQVHFEQVHPHFFDRLLERCPNLTEENLRMCAYCRLGMSIRQISQLLNITDHAVSTSRLRIKKKLKVPDEIDIDTFLKNL